MLEIKGMAVRDTVLSLQERLGPDGLERLLATAGEQARALCTEAVNVSSWYALDAYADLLEADVRADGGDVRGLMERAEKVFEKQLGGIYRVFVQLASPETLLRRISGAHETYFRGAKATVLACEKGRAVVRYAGLTGRHQVIEHVIQSFFRKALSLTGAKDVEVRVTTSLTQGKGVCDFELTWR